MATHCIGLIFAASFNLNQAEISQGQLSFAGKVISQVENAADGAMDLHTLRLEDKLQHTACSWIYRSHLIAGRFTTQCIAY